MYTAGSSLAYTMHLSPPRKIFLQLFLSQQDLMDRLLGIQACLRCYNTIVGICEELEEQMRVPSYRCQCNVSCFGFPAIWIAYTY